MSATAQQPGVRRHRVREVDFRRPNKFTREQVRRLEHAHDGFCQAAASRLSAELRTELQLSVVGTDQLPYSVVMGDEVPRHSFVSVLRIDELGTDIALIMDLPLAQTLVQRLLGGSPHAPGGSSPTSPTSLTAVETAVARRAVASLVDGLSATWTDLAEVSLSLSGTSTNPTQVQLVPSSEPTLILNVSAAVDGVMSIITLLLPHRSVEPLMHHFEQGALHGPPTGDDARNRELMKSAVGEVDVEVRAEAGAVKLPLAEVLAMKPGDTIRLKRPVERGVTLCVGDVEAYDAAPGRNGNLRAVQVKSTLGEGPPVSEFPADALMDVKVRVWAEIGRTQMPLADAVALDEGVLIDLDREHHEPIDLFVNGLLYGRGHLVMVDGEWALTVDEIVASDSAVERLSSGS